MHQSKATAAAARPLHHHLHQPRSRRPDRRTRTMMNKAAAATLLLALVATATAVTTHAATMPDDAVTAMSSTGGHGGRRHRGPTWRDHDGGGSSNRSPLSGLTECVTVCGTGVTRCMLDCYKPGVGFDPVGLPICLLKCTNDAMVCGSGCATNLI